MAKVLPFVVQPQTEIRAIGTPEIGIIHLLKKGGVAPSENPVDLQEAATRQAEVQLLLRRATRRLAKEEDIKLSEARKRLFGMPIRDAESGDEVAEDSSFYDFLNEDEAKLLLSLREDVAQTAIRAATLFIRYRVAYPVRIAVAAKAKLQDVFVDPLSFPIEPQQKIRYGQHKIEVCELAEAGDEAIATKPLPVELEAEAIGYLLEPSGKTKLGNADWTENDTRECMTEELILAIYSFYQAEMSGLSEHPSEQPEQEVEDDEQGKSLAPGCSNALPAAA